MDTNNKPGSEYLTEAELQSLAKSMGLSKQQNPNSMQAPVMFQPGYQENLIKWQLDIKEELARIEHLLRKHIPKIDDKGNAFFVEPVEEDQLFNETGINEILNLLAWYLNKNLILSNFTEEQINQRCSQFMLCLTDFIFNNYQRFGLDTKEKIKHYPMVIMNLVNTIEAAYNRALGGAERDSLRTARQVMQTEPIQSQYPFPMPQQSQKSFLKPWTWGK